MSIAEQLIREGKEEGRQEGLQEGRQEGLQKGLQAGVQAGRIQLCQELLGLPVVSKEELAQQNPSQLERLLNELQARLRQRVK